MSIYEAMQLLHKHDIRIIEFWFWHDGYIGIEYFPFHDPIHDLQQIHAKHHTG